MASSGLETGVDGDADGSDRGSVSVLLPIKEDLKKDVDVMGAWTTGITDPSRKCQQLDRRAYRGGAAIRAALPRFPHAVDKLVPCG